MNSPAAKPDLTGGFSALLDKHESQLPAPWVSEQLSSPTLRKDLMKESELREQSGHFLLLLRTALKSGNFTNTSRPEWDPVRDFLTDISKSRATKGFSPSETASFVFSLRPPLLELIQRERGLNTKEVSVDMGAATTLLDKLGLFTFEEYRKTREGIINRRQQEMMELSTPVVRCSRA